MCSEAVSSHKHSVPPLADWTKVAAFACAHDVDGVIAHCHPEIAWETQWPGFESVLRGPEGVRRFFELFEEAIAEVSPTFCAIETLGDQVLLEVVLKGHGRGSRIPVETTVFDIWTFRHGKLFRRQTFYTRAAEWQGCSGHQSATGIVAPTGDGDEATALPSIWAPSSALRLPRAREPISALRRRHYRANQPSRCMACSRQQASTGVIGSRVVAILVCWREE